MEEEAASSLEKTKKMMEETHKRDKVYIAYDLSDETVFTMYLHRILLKLNIQLS